MRIETWQRGKGYPAQADGDDDRDVYQSGVKWWGRTRVWSETREHLVVKVDGGTTWSGRGSRSYVPATFIVNRIVEKGPTYWRVERLLDFPMKGEADR